MRTPQQAITNADLVVALHKEFRPGYPYSVAAYTLEHRKVTSRQFDNLAQAQAAFGRLAAVVNPATHYVELDYNGSLLNATPCAGD